MIISGEIRKTSYPSYTKLSQVTQFYGRDLDI